MFVVELTGMRALYNCESSMPAHISFPPLRSRPTGQATCWVQPCSWWRSQACVRCTRVTTAVCRTGTCPELTRQLCSLTWVRYLFFPDVRSRCRLASCALTDLGVLPFLGTHLELSQLCRLTFFGEACKINGLFSEARVHFVYLLFCSVTEVV